VKLCLDVSPFSTLPVSIDFLERTTFISTELVKVVFDALYVDVVVEYPTPPVVLIVVP
jgi:hypothetical protein